MSSCNGNCSSCGSDCSDRKAESLLAQLNKHASVKKVIAVVSGKGGVGKSTVTSMLSVAMARKTEKERVGYNLLWGTAALALMLGAFAVLSVKLWLGL